MTPVVAAHRDGEMKAMVRWCRTAAVVLLAIVLLSWAVPAMLDLRANPILVTTVRPGRTPAPAFPGGAAFVEVEVARERPLRMDVVEVPIAGAGAGGTVHEADPAAVAAERKALHAALEEWLATPGRDLRIAQTWDGVEKSTLFGFARQRARVVLHARLVPASAAAK